MNVDKALRAIKRARNNLETAEAWLSDEPVAPEPEPDPEPEPSNPFPDAAWYGEVEDWTTPETGEQGLRWFPAPPGRYRRFILEYEVYVPPVHLAAHDRFCLHWAAINANNRDGLLSYAVVKPGRGLLHHQHGLGMPQEEKPYRNERARLLRGVWMSVRADYDCWSFSDDSGVSTLDVWLGKTLASVTDDRDVVALDVWGGGIRVDLGFSASGNEREVPVPGMRWRNIRAWLFA